MSLHLLLSWSLGGGKVPLPCVGVSQGGRLTKFLSSPGYLEHKSSVFYALSPLGKPPTLLVADADSIRAIGLLPAVFSKPLEIYKLSFFPSLRL